MRKINAGEPVHLNIDEARTGKGTGVSGWAQAVNRSDPAAVNLNLRQSLAGNVCFELHDKLILDPRSNRTPAPLCRSAIDGAYYIVSPLVTGKVIQ